jgi:dTDP-L-rhamnose 4-epimerase
VARSSSSDFRSTSEHRGEHVRVLVTGGAGFIGSHVVDAFIERGDEVRVVDALLPAAHDGAPSYLDARVEYLWGDICDGDLLADALRGCEVVSHQAAMVGLGVDFGDVETYCHHNDLGTASLLGALHRADFAGRLVVASSMVVYGEGQYRCPDHAIVRPAARSPERLEAGRWEPVCDCGADLVAEPIAEDAFTEPRNVYAATKLHQEHLCAAYEREHPRVSVVALRYHNVYGARMPHDTPYAGVASLFRSALARGRAPQVFEDGGQRRDFIHVHDVARVNVLATQRDDARGLGAINVATGSPRTVLDMARSIASGFGDDGRTPEVVGGYRLGDVRHVFASPAKAARELGFRASVDFDAGMAAFATDAPRQAHPVG